MSKRQEGRYESFSSNRISPALSQNQLEKNTIKTCQFVLSDFNNKFGKRDLRSISSEEVLSFLVSLTRNNTQATKRNRYSVLTSFFNFTINTSQPDLPNPCSSAVIKKVFKRPQPNQWQIIDKDIVDEIISGRILANTR